MSDATAKTPAPPARPNEYQLAATVARHVELRNVSLLSMHADLKAPLSDAVRAMSGGSIDAALDWNASPELASSNDGLLVVTRYTVRVLCKATQEHEAREVVVLAAAFQLDYRLAVPPPEAERAAMLVAFANMNGIYNSWPYVRELVQSTCARMGLPPVILPVYRAKVPPKKVSPPAEKVQKSES